MQLPPDEGPPTANRPPSATPSSAPHPAVMRLAGVALLLVLTVAVAHAFARGGAAPPTTGVGPVPPEPAAHLAPHAEQAYIEVAFVLDTTGSMSGLIEGAKAKIWEIANRLASSRQNAPLRMALIGYRDRGDAYVTRRFDFRDDIDAIYAELRGFQAAGGGDGPESVNQALYEAIHALSWSPGDEVYRVVFLVGDAPPHLDYANDVSYAETAREARRRGIVVNTVQCGSDPGTAPVWREIAALATGQYARIAQDGGMLAMEAPMDGELARLNREMAATALPYGAAKDRAALEAKVARAVAAPAPAVASRLAYLSKLGGRVVSGASDLVDAVKEGLDLDAVEPEELPQSLRALAPEERRRVVADKLEQRERIQTQIDRLSRERDRWIESQSERLREEGREDGFAATVFEAVKRQAARKGILYE